MIFVRKTATYKGMHVAKLSALCELQSAVFYGGIIRGDGV